MSVGHRLCVTLLFYLWVPGLDQCLWVTLSVGHSLFLFGSLGLISVCGSPSVCVCVCVCVCHSLFLLCAPGLDQCLWVTLCLNHSLFLFVSLGLISVCRSPSVCVSLFVSLCPLA